MADKVTYYEIRHEVFSAEEASETIVAREVTAERAITKAKYYIDNDPMLRGHKCIGDYMSGQSVAVYCITVEIDGDCVDYRDEWVW